MGGDEDRAVDNWACSWHEDDVRGQDAGGDKSPMDKSSGVRPWSRCRLRGRGRQHSAYSQNGDNNLIRKIHRIQQILT